MRQWKWYLAVSISFLFFLVISCSKDDNPVEPIVPPGTVPAQVVLSSPTNGAADVELSAKFEWNSISDASSYHIQISTVQNFSSTAFQDSILTASKTSNFDLIYFQKYFWRVRAKNKNGIGLWSQVFEFTTKGTLPLPVVLTSPANGLINSPTATSLSWNKGQYSDSYHVQLSTEQNFQKIYLQDSTLTTTSYSTANLANDQIFYWRVRGKNKLGVGSWSNVSQFTTIDTYPPQVQLTAPTNASRDLSISSQFQWISITNASSYHIQISVNQNFQNNFFQDSTLASTSVTVNNFAYNQKYYWRVRAKNSFGTGAWSSIFEFTTIINFPGQAQLTSPLNNSADISLPVNFQWSSIQDASTYHIQISTTSGFQSIVTQDSLLLTTTKSLGNLEPGQKYYWRVRGKNSRGNGLWSNIFNFSTAANLPGQVQLTSPLNNANNISLPVNFEWTSIQDVSTYHIQISTVSGFQSIVTQDSLLTTTTKSFGNLERGQKYYWRVRGKNTRGHGPWSDIFSFITIGNPPAQIQLILPANGVKDLAVNLIFQWSAIQNADSYHIQISVSQNFQNNFFQDSTLTSTSATVNNFAYNQKYYWRVRAKNAFGLGAWSSNFEFTTAANLPDRVQLTFPLNNATNISLPINFQWTSIQDVSTYHIQISTVTGFQSIVAQDSLLTTTNKSISNLNPGQKYYWRVKGKGAGGTGPWSDIFNFTTVGIPPIQVQLTSPANGVKDLAITSTFQWSAMQNADSYHIQISVNQSFQNNFFQDSILTSTSATVNNFAYNQKYYWRVRAKNAFGAGAWSSIFEFTTIINFPGQIQLTSPLNNSVNISLPVNFQWTSIQDVSTYHIQISTVSGFQSIVVQDSLLTATTKTLGNLESGQKYYWRVRGKNTRGNGPWSNIFNFTIGSPPVQVQLTSPANGAKDLAINSIFQWSAIQNINSYHIQISADQNYQNKFFQDSTLTSASVTVNNFAYNQKYYWRVRAKNAFGLGAWSGSFEFTTAANLPDQVQLALPLNNAVNVLLPIVFQWFPVQDASTYHIQISTLSSFQSVVTQDSLLTTTTKSIASLDPNQKYYWRVRAKNQFGAGGWSSIFEFTTGSNLPDEVQLTSPSNGITNALQPINFQWASVSFVINYHIQVSALSDFQTIFFEDSTLTNNQVSANVFYFSQKYYWRVRAKNNFGAGQWSQIFELTTAASPLVATWKMTKVTVNLGGINLDLTPEQANAQMTIICRSDRTFDATLISSGTTTVDYGTWSATDKFITLNYQFGNPETLEYTLSGNKLVIKNKMVPGPNNTTIPATLEFTKQ